MTIALTCIIAIAAIVFILWIRPGDLPAPEPESPFRHLDDRKAAIYENLRDLQFEYRVGKLSEADYQTTKKDLQRELAGVLAEVDKLKNGMARTAPAPAARPAAPPKPAAAREPEGWICDSCGARFEKELKFCGECGRPMKVAK